MVCGVMLGMPSSPRQPSGCLVVPLDGDKALPGPPEGSP